MRIAKELIGEFGGWQHGESKLALPECHDSDRTPSRFPQTTVQKHQKRSLDPN